MSDTCIAMLDLGISLFPFYIKADIFVNSCVYMMRVSYLYVV